MSKELFNISILVKNEDCFKAQALWAGFRLLKMAGDQFKRIMNLDRRLNLTTFKGARRAFK